MKWSQSVSISLNLAKWQERRKKVVCCFFFSVDCGQFSIVLIEFMCLRWLTQAQSSGLRLNIPIRIVCVQLINKSISLLLLVLVCFFFVRPTEQKHSVQICMKFIAARVTVFQMQHSIISYLFSLILLLVSFDFLCVEIVIILVAFSLVAHLK